MSLPFTVSFPEGWRDITDELDFPNKPWTLAHDEGVGALQFTVCLYQDGVIPDPAPGKLLEMLYSFAHSCGFDSPTDLVTEDAPIRLAAVSFRIRDNFVRVWFVSNGFSFAQITYTSEWDSSRHELPHCERMVRSLKFKDGQKAH